jgi:hypothetical protein
VLEIPSLFAQALVTASRERATGRRGVHTSERTMIELHERIVDIKSKADLVEFVQALRGDLQANEREWENAR